MSHGLNAQQVDNLPHCHVFFGHMTDPGDIAFTWKHSSGQPSLRASLPSLLTSEAWLADRTDDDNEEVQHLFGQTIPLCEFIL